ncbi:MAG: hypothetical protein FWE38_00785 [Firmicutes bacterium]|nr:hypothetical protein [Bacillota bacterium]
MTNKISEAIPRELVIGLLNLEPKGSKPKDFIVEYVQGNAKLKEIIVDNLERQCAESKLDLPVAVKDDIIVAIFAQYMADEMQWAYGSEMDKKTLAITIDTSSVAGASGYSDEIVGPGYKRQKAIDELRAAGLTNQTTFKGVLDEQIKEDEKKGLVKANYRDGGTDGRFYGSHAERELSRRTDRPIGVSRRMCNECVRYFRSLESQRIVVDPDFIWVYWADGNITTLLNNSSSKQLEMKMRNFYKKYGK